MDIPASADCTAVANAAVIVAVSLARLDSAEANGKALVAVTTAVSLTVEPPDSVLAAPPAMIGAKIIG